MQQADNHNVIRVRGARVNNLKNVDVDIPKRRLTVVTGLSGSGKSSLVFGTIAAESQRLINETYSAFVQGFMPAMARPDVETLDGLTTAIIVDQQRMGSDPRSTVGTATDANALLRVLYSRLGTPHIGSAQAFSFNVPSARGVGALTVEKGNARAEKKVFEIVGGMCPTCEGRGSVSDFEMSELFDESLSISEGAIRIPGYKVDNQWTVGVFAQSGFIDVDKPIKSFSKKMLDDFLYKEPTKVKVNGINLTYEGLIPKIQKSMLSKDKESMQPHIRAFVERAVVFRTCPDCEGTRLSAQARSSKISGKSIADLCSMQISDLVAWVRELKEPAAKPLLEKLTHLLEGFVDIGLGYLALDRPAGTLSGGEAQRVKMIRHLGSALTDVTYVFDEPTAGLHSHDIQRMNGLLQQLRDKGNTVLVVEHKPQVMEIADLIIDIGPGAGADGGEIVYQGDLAGLKKAGTVTGEQMDHRLGLREEVRESAGVLKIRGANANNLRDVDVDVPLGVFVAITGVAGSGKSSLISHLVAGREDVALLDQAPIRGSRRSNPATYSGLLDQIRTLFAKENGVKPALFSANSEGACPACGGLGVIYTELGFMATVSAPCEECEGRRFRPDVLEYKLHGLAIDEVLDLSVAAAMEVLTTGKASKILTTLNDVGLGYLTIGQPLTSLSGGERQRLKLANSLLANDAEVYVLDEPTSGLHLADTENMVNMVHGIVDAGKSVIVIEHNLAVIAQADWVIDIGPGAGHDGGTVVFEGTPAEMVKKADTLTAQHLSRWVEGA